MKKIIGYCLFLIIITFYVTTVAAATEMTIISTPSEAKVGQTINFQVKVTAVPTNADKIELYLSATPLTDSNQWSSHLKGSVAANPGAQEQTYNYPWNTQAASSQVGNHYILAALYDSSRNLLTKSYISYYLAASDSGNSSNNSGTSSLDLDKLGKITFPSTKIASAEELIIATISWLLFILGILAVVAIVYSGLMYITAGSDPTRAEAAKKNLVWAIIGVVIAALSYLLVELVAKIISGK